MKKGIVLLLLSVCIASGCTGNTDEQINEKTNKQIIIEDDYEKEGEKSVISNYESDYIGGKTSSLKYTGQFVFLDIIRTEVEIKEELLWIDDKAIFVKLFLDPIDGVPEERLIIGYFYETNDVIYKIAPSEENLEMIINNGEIPQGSVIVGQSEPLGDVLSENEEGFHHYIDVEGDEIEFHSFNNLTETGYYETIIWEKNIGLKLYRSGYGAERESIKLEIRLD